MIKIEKFTRLKNGNYKLVLDNKLNIEVHEDLILKHDLLLTKSLNEELIETILEEQKIYDIYNIALKYIKVRMRSIKEIENYLLKKKYEQNQIDDALSILKKQGYLNNDNYAKAFIHDKIVLSNYGPLKIKDELIKNGIEIEKIEESIIEFTEELELERINKLVTKYLKTIHNTSSYMLKRKIENNLNNLGYHNYLIQEVLNSLDINDEEEYKKEYEKLYKKLSRKYEGKELEIKIKQKLYQKGYKVN